MNTAPVALFVYNRPFHTRETVRSLAENTLATSTELFIFSDGSKPGHENAVAEVREFLHGIKGFKSVHIVERTRNHGLAASVVSGVSWVLERYNSVIVLEDDMVSAPFFLEYMNDALSRYRDDVRVGSIQAFSPPVSNLPDYYFLLGADCWGWATWRDRWHLLQTDALELLRTIRSQGRLQEYDTNGAEGQLEILLLQVLGKAHSWHALWYATTFLHGLLALHPGKPYIRNIGSDGSGTHRDDNTVMDGNIATAYAGPLPVEVKENTLVRDRFRQFYKDSFPLSPLARMQRWLRYTVAVPALCSFPALTRHVYPGDTLRIGEE